MTKIYNFKKDNSILSLLNSKFRRLRKNKIVNFLKVNNSIKIVSLSYKLFKFVQFFNSQFRTIKLNVVSEDK